jgi:hypothetical protein
MSGATRRLHVVALALLAAPLFVATSACDEDDGPGDGGSGGGEPSEPAWRVVFDDGALDRALLSIWGTSSTDVFAVGGPLGNDGFDALALHFDGQAWTDLQPGGADSFWWVHGLSSTDVWMVGENGRIAHYDGTAFEEHESGTTATLWGAIAFAADDAWAVGGMPGGEATGPDDVVLHWDGTAWEPVVLPGEPLSRALFKIWGTSSDDLFVVGEYGAIWHRDGAEWILESEPPVATGNLTTVHGCSATDVYAVGGRDLLIVGGGGLKQRRVDGAWSDDFTEDPHGDLHGVWVDETGAFWAAGGDFLSSQKPGKARNGIIARYGPGTVPSALE